MKKRDLYALQNGLRSMGHLKGAKFSYGLAKNKKRIDAEIELLEEIRKPSEEMNEYERQRIELCESLCLRNEDGSVNFLVSDENPELKQYQFGDKHSEFDQKFSELKERYRSALETHSDKMKEFVSLLDEPLDIEFYKISLESVPNDIRSEEMTLIEPLIRE